MKKLFIILSFIVMLAGAGVAQNINQINARCPSPNTLVFQRILLNNAGNALFDPCPSGSSIFTQTVDFSAATVILPGGGAPVSGSGTTNFIPRWTDGAAGVLGNTPFSWNATTYTFNNTALNSQATLAFTPSLTGSFNVGDFTTTPTTYLTQSYLTGVSRLVSSGSIYFGNESGATGITTNTATGTLDIVSAAAATVTSASSITATGPSGITLDSDAAFTKFGDINGGGNFTTFNLDDSTATIAVRAGALVQFDTRSGAFNAGDLNAVGNDTKITLDDGTRTVTINNNNAGLRLNGGGAGTSILGDWNSANNSTILKVDDGNRIFDFFTGGGGNAVFDLDKILDYQLQRTITAAATTGNQTINKPAGTVNFAAAATDITVTNSVATTTSIIICTVQSLDATAISCRVTNKAAGSFHIRVPAATAETSVAFWVLN